MARKSYLKYICKTAFNTLCKFFIHISLMYVRAKYFTGFFRIPLATFLICHEVNGSVWRLKGLSLSFDRQLPITTKKRSGQKLTKLMDNPRFVGEETIPLVQDEDYDDSNTPNTSRKTSFTRHHSRNLMLPKQHRRYN